MNLANKISIGRIILVPLFIAAIIYSRMDLALWIFMLAIISDAIDGYIARTQNQKTRLGTLLDPVADKLLIVSAFICLTILKSVPQQLKFPPYVPIIVISRDAIIVLGSIVIYLVTGDLKIQPSAIGKVTAFFQMMTIASVLFHFKYSHIIWNLMVGLTVISGVDYVIKGSRFLNGTQATLKRPQDRAS